MVGLVVALVARVGPEVRVAPVVLGAKEVVVKGQHLLRQVVGTLRQHLVGLLVMALPRILTDKMILLMLTRMT